MSKYCPKCARQYPDDRIFCDLDGAELSRASAINHAAQKHRNRWKILLVATVAVAVIAVTTFFALGAYMRGGVEVTVEDISIAQKDSANSSITGKVIEKITGATKAVFGKGDLVARLKVRNNTSLSVCITAAQYSIFLGEKEIGKGQWVAIDGAPAAFRAREDLSLELPFRLDSQSLLASVIESLGGKDSPLHVEGEMTLQLAVFSVTVPFKTDYAQAESPREKPPTY